jgi:CMP-N,N'-diacetyllegionaminic acid synthase
MKILAIIPARGGSKGVPRKNIKLLNGTPLIEYSITAAKDSNLITEILVNSDDDEILNIAKKNNVTLFKRKPELATDTSSSIDVVLDTLNELEKQNKFYDAVILLQPTSPFRPKYFIDESIEKFNKNGFDSLISVLEVPHEYNPHWTFELKDNLLQIATGDKEIIKRRQDLPKAYFRDGSIYITKKEVLMQQKSFYGNSLGFIESNPEYYCNIDTMKDWENAELLVKKIIL